MFVCVGVCVWIIAYWCMHSSVWMFMFVREWVCVWIIAYWCMAQLYLDVHVCV